jgi:multidrug efflux pump subunit AcrB
MRLPKLAIENHQFTIIVITLLVLSGVVSFFNMPRSEDPQVSPPASSIIAVYPGANPTVLEELVVDPIEEVINELEDIKDIKTTIQDGLAVINVEFLTGSDPDDKYSDVVQKVNSIRNELPEDLAKLELMKWSITDVKIIQVALVSETASYRELEKEADLLKRQFERVSGIKKVEARAYPEQEIRISLDMEQIAANNITLGRVINMIQSSNANIPGGFLDIGSKRFNIETSGSYESLDAIRNTIIDAGKGKIVYLKDIADVDYSYEDESYRARYNGERAVFVMGSQKIGTNIFNVYDGLKKAITEFKSHLPVSIRLEMVFDQSQSVSYRVDGFFSNLLQGLILVGLVVLLAVGLRASMIVILAIPLSILIAIGFVDLSGYGLEQMSIAGLVIALGLLVDNAIVVTENISRFIKMGHSRFEAAVKGTSQIAWAIVSSTVTTVLAFVPMIMMQNITGDFIRSMPVTVVFTLSASLLISLTLTPYLSSRILRQTDMVRESRFRKILDVLIETKYRNTLDYALKHPAIVILISTVIFLGSLSLFPLVGVSFFPKAEKPQFLIDINLPEGTSLDKTDDVARFVESVLAERDEVFTYASNIGRGNPRIYYNAVSRHEKSNYAQIFVEIKTHDLDIFNKTINELRQKFNDYAGAKIEIKEFEQGPPVEAPVAIRVMGEELDKLKMISNDIEQIISSEKGTINTSNPLSTTKTDLHVDINRAKAGILGVPIAEIDRTVRAAINGLNISNYRDDAGKEYKLVIRLPFAKKPQLKDFDRIYVASVSGAQIPLKQLATIRFESSPQLINHYNLERNVLLTADVLSGHSVNDITLDIIKKMDDYTWPEGYRYSVGGELESREESFGGMLQAVIIAVIGIIAVLVLQFRSYTQPIIVFSAIPLAVIGSIFALLITGYSFSFTAFIGLSSLVGIVINNSIILVDYTNQLRAEGKEITAALKEAGETRFIPIILTTGTTIGGLLPLTLGGGTLWAPMGWTIIGGLLVSTFLTLVIVPVLYKIFTAEVN